MIIDSNNNVNSPTTTNAKARAVAENKQPSADTVTKPAAKETDSVSLSGKAQAMGRLEAQIAETPDVDEAKVAAVKAAISEGRYQVDSNTVAERMLAQDKLLG